MSVIDGERKIIVRRVSPATMRFEGLVPRSVWEARKAEPGITIVTQRAFMGAMLHDQTLQGQYPSVGHIFPAALLSKRSGRTRSGKAMAAHLNRISTQRSAERAAWKAANKVTIL